MTAIARSHPGHWADKPDSRILNLEAQLDMLREARRDATYAYERDEIEARRAQLRKELIDVRRALNTKPASVNVFRRFLAALLSA